MIRQVHRWRCVETRCDPAKTCHRCISELADLMLRTCIGLYVSVMDAGDSTVEVVVNNYYLGEVEGPWVFTAAEWGRALDESQKRSALPLTGVDG